MGAKFAPKSNVARAIETNPDGFGMAYYTKGDECVSVFRTLNASLFKKRYAEVCKRDPQNTAVLIHARIKTHGTVKLENVHCWSDEATGLVFAHNGILSIHNREDMTDSETFFRDIFLPVLSYGGWEAAEKSISAVIGSSKFAFFDSRTGQIHVYGKFIEDKGVLYSNSSYKKVKVAYTPLYFNDSYRSSYGNDWVWDDKTGHVICKSSAPREQRNRAIVAHKKRSSLK